MQDNVQEAKFEIEELFSATKKIREYLEKTISYDVKTLGRDHPWSNKYLIGEIEDAFEVLKENNIL